MLSFGDPSIPDRAAQRTAVRETGQPGETAYRLFRNNCHDYVGRIIARLRG